MEPELCKIRITARRGRENVTEKGDYVKLPTPIPPWKCLTGGSTAAAAAASAAAASSAAAGTRRRFLPPPPPPPPPSHVLNVGQVIGSQSGKEPREVRLSEKPKKEGTDSPRFILPFLALLASSGGQRRRRLTKFYLLL